MIWWYWILFALVLAAIELATPGGFFFAFFAVAALLVGLLELAGLVESDAIQWGIFPAIAVACLVLFRRPMLHWMNRSERGEAIDSLVGELVVPAGSIGAGEHGRAELRGAMWSVRNVDAFAVATGERCRVVGVRGLELDIRAERSR